MVVKFKSDGERKIAEFLKKRKLRYTYEKPLLIKDTLDNKLQIWHPDFYLDDFNIVLEYFGMVDKAEYTRSMKRKQAIYHTQRVDFISIYPEMIKDKDFEKILWDKIRNILIAKLKKLKSHKEMYFKSQNKELPTKTSQNKEPLKKRKSVGDDWGLE
tara:strand:- start:50616 stop:51086 length:471 start_codon:yes stop_codon:yes gene_type:complete